MARLGFTLVWLGLFWFGLFPCLKEKGGGNTGGENIMGKELAGRRPSG